MSVWAEILSCSTLLPLADYWAPDLICSTFHIRGCANKTGFIEWREISNASAIHCAHDTFQAGHPAARLDLAPQPLEAENGLIGPSGIAVQQA
jgi:hypothetical protein